MLPLLVSMLEDLTKQEIRAILEPPGTIETFIVCRLRTSNGDPTNDYVYSIHRYHPVDGLETFQQDLNASRAFSHFTQILVAWIANHDD